MPPARRTLSASSTAARSLPRLSWSWKQGQRRPSGRKGKARRRSPAAPAANGRRRRPGKRQPGRRTNGRRWTSNRPSHRERRQGPRRWSARAPIPRRHRAPRRMRRDSAPGRWTRNTARRRTSCPRKTRAARRRTRWPARCSESRLSCAPSARRAFRASPRRSSPTRPRARAGSTPLCRPERPTRTTSFWRTRPTPRTTSPILSTNT